MGKSQNVLRFPGRQPVRDLLAWFCRLGATGHQQLADIHAAGDLPLERVVVDASMWAFQKDLARSLQRDGAELVLDTKVAELSSPARYIGRLLDAPWSGADGGAPLGPNLFRRAHPADVVSQIARFAAVEGVDRR